MTTEALEQIKATIRKQETTKQVKNGLLRAVAFCQLVDLVGDINEGYGSVTLSFDDATRTYHVTTKNGTERLNQVYDATSLLEAIIGE